MSNRCGFIVFQVKKNFRAPNLVQYIQLKKYSGLKNQLFFFNKASS